MNLELNVVRFENEDVIATSGFCSANDAMHVKVTGALQGNIYPAILFSFVNNEWKKTQFPCDKDVIPGDPDVGSYYYFNEGNYVKCNGTHNDNIAK